MNSTQYGYIKRHEQFIFHSHCCDYSSLEVWKSMASNRFSFILSSALNMKDASDDDDSLFGEGDFSENDSLGLYDEKSQNDEETDGKREWKTC